MSTDGLSNLEITPTRVQTVSVNDVCAHCKKPNQSTVLHRSNELWFCCQGCKAVYTILITSGLGDYYRQKDKAFCIREPSPVITTLEQFESWNSPQRNVVMFLEGVHCTACLWLVEKLPELLPDTVLCARLDLGRSLLQVTLTETGKISQAATLLNSWGYRPHLVTSDKHSNELQEKESRKTLIELGIAGALAGNVMLMSVPLYAGIEGSLGKMFEWFSAILSIPSLFYSGRSFFLNVYSSFKQKKFSIDTPILLALVVAFIYSFFNLLLGNHDLYFDSLTALIFLLLSSRYFLQRLRQYGFGKDSAFTLLDGDARLSPGETIELTEDTSVQCDGVISEGRGYFDLSFITGESFPVLLKEGDSVFAGSRFVGKAEGHFVIKIKVQSTGRDTRIEKILAEVKSAQNKRSDFEHHYDRWAKYLLWAVCTVAIIALAYFAYQNQLSDGVQRTLALLIVTCPCALALATPLTLSLALRTAYQNGIVVKDVNAFERAIDIQNVVFDKTGTLTNGKMEVASIDIPVEYTSHLRSLVQNSSHPISRAIFAYLGSGVVRIISNYRETPGIGISAEINGDIWSLERNNTNNQNELSSVVFKKGSMILGGVYLSDQTREESQDVIQKLIEKNYSTYILSGDQESVVNKVANLLHVRTIKSFSRKSPEEKGQIIEALSKKNATLMVGDGVNDAIALSKADVSISVQGGLEAALKSSDVYSLKSGIRSVLHFLDLSLQTKHILKRNFYFSTTYNLTSAILALSGLMSPLVAAILMPLSAATVFAATTYSFSKLKGRYS